MHWYPYLLEGGGVSNGVVGLATAQAEAGADVWAGTLSGGTPLYGPLPTGEVRIAAWNGRSVGRRNIRLHFLRRATARALVSIRPDIVHIHGEFNPDNWWAPTLWRCPLILSPHGAFHTVVRERGQKQKRLYRYAASVLLYRNVARFHALSPSEAKHIKTIWPSARTYCVPQGPSPSVVKSLTLRDEPRIARREQIHVLFIGRLDVRTKGLDVLLEAFARATRDEGAPLAILTLVGPDWRDGRSQLGDLAQRLRIKDSVVIGRSVNLDEVPDLLRSCDIYVQLSRHEGSPLSLNDALVLGKPVIVSDQVGTISYKEISRLPHVTVVQPTILSATAAIRQTLANLDALSLAGRRARADLRNFLSWDRAARLHLSEYEILVADRAGRRLLGSC